MDNRLTEIVDKALIAELIQKWGFWRDSGEWAKLRGTFHEGGTITVTWFSGPFNEFVERSMQMRKTRSRSKHSIGGSLIRLSGRRALAESNVVITNRQSLGGTLFDSTAWGRFYDLLEKRSDEWKIRKRTAIYEKDRLDPLEPIASLPYTPGDLKRLPEAYCHLGYALTEGGFPVAGDLPTPSSPELARLYAEGERWLAGVGE